MPIYEYSCTNCGTKIEKTTLSALKSVPVEIANPCQKCHGLTRHERIVSVPAVVSHAPGNNPSFSMKDLRPSKDKGWKNRILQGLNPDGKPLTDRKAESAAAWQSVMPKIDK